jgi:hypothetical protein
MALSPIRTIYNSLQHALSLLSLLCLHQLSPGNSSQRCRFLSFRVPRLQSSLVGAYLTTELGVAWFQSSIKGYSSRPYGSGTAHSNHRLKTVLLCPWPPSQGPGPGLTVCRPTQSPNYLKATFGSTYIASGQTPQKHFWSQCRRISWKKK